jgi:sugar phosphate isomerase/epimerase
VRAYLDLGNMIFGHPEHWVRIAGSRIVKVHIKDFRFDRARGRLAFGKLGDGAVDWNAVRAALLDVGFSSYITSTGIPRGRLNHWIARGVRLSRRRVGALPGASRLERALSALRRRGEILFLHDAARRFDRFRDGSLAKA